MTIRPENYDHNKIVAGLEALQLSVENLLMEKEWGINDSVDHASLQERIARSSTQRGSEPRKTNSVVKAMS